MLPKYNGKLTLKSTVIVLKLISNVNSTMCTVYSLRFKSQIIPIQRILCSMPTTNLCSISTPTLSGQQSLITLGEWRPVLMLSPYWQYQRSPQVSSHPLQLTYCCLVNRSSRKATTQLIRRNHYQRAPLQLSQQAIQRGSDLWHVPIHQVPSKYQRRTPL